VNELRRRAIGLLARREHSRAELTRKLAADGNLEEIETVLAQLETEGLLSDARYAEAYVRSHAERFGAARLRQTLRSKGIDAALVNSHVGELRGELERARVVWAKKFATSPTDPREWARQARFLQSRGFAVEVIRQLLREPAE
jgi:regulatory protein